MYVKIGNVLSLTLAKMSIAPCLLFKYATVVLYTTQSAPKNSQL